MYIVYVQVQASMYGDILVEARRTLLAQYVSLHTFCTYYVHCTVHETSRRLLENEHKLSTMATRKKIAIIIANHLYYVGSFRFCVYCLSQIEDSSNIYCTYTRIHSIPIQCMHR